MSEKMREDFESWSAGHDYLGGVELDRAISGNYADVDMQHAWDAWQAARASAYTAIDISTAAAEGFRDGVASVIVKLPKSVDDKSNVCHLNKYAVMQAIIAAGASVNLDE